MGGISGWVWVALMHHLETAALTAGAMVLGILAVTTDGIRDGLAIAGGVVLLLGVLWRVVVIPNLRREFGEPINKTHKLAEDAKKLAEDTNRQVKENGGKSTPPTVPDLIGKVLAEQTATNERLERLERRQAKEVDARVHLVEQLDRHLDWSNDIVVKLTSEIAQKQDRE